MYQLYHILHYLWMTLLPILQLGGKLDPNGNGQRKKAGVGSSATMEEPVTELSGKDMRLVKGKSMPSLR